MTTKDTNKDYVKTVKLHGLYSVDSTLSEGAVSWHRTGSRWYMGMYSEYHGRVMSTPIYDSELIRALKKAARPFSSINIFETNPRDLSNLTVSYNTNTLAVVDFIDASKESQPELDEREYMEILNKNPSYALFYGFVLPDKR